MFICQLLKTSVGSGYHNRSRLRHSAAEPDVVSASRRNLMDLEEKLAMMPLDLHVIGVLVPYGLPVVVKLR